MKIRGLAYRRLGKYEKAAIDLSNAMKIDYDPDIKDILDFISKRMAKISVSIQSEESVHRVMEAL